VKKTLGRLAGTLGKKSSSASAADAGRRKSVQRAPIKVPTRSSSDVTGQTIFDDRPLRFRSLTSASIDLRELEEASSIAGAFKIRVAKVGGPPRESGVLVERRYAGRGYEIPATPNDPYLHTFLAYDEGVIVGTVGVRLDSPLRLAADDLYREEIAQLRSEGRRLCEFTRLAVDSTTASKPVLAGLFHTAYLFASKVKDYTHAVIEVNPRHVDYYGKALKFEAIGPERMNLRVNAPAVLLCVSFATIADGIAKYAGKPEVPGANRSLFLHGFNAKDEYGVLQRLRDLVGGAVAA
jgi:hypothetical protein